MGGFISHLASYSLCPIRFILTMQDNPPEHVTSLDNICLLNFNSYYQEHIVSLIFIQSSKNGFIQFC